MVLNYPQKGRGLSHVIPFLKFSTILYFWNKWRYALQILHIDRLWQVTFPMTLSDVWRSFWWPTFWIFWYLSISSERTIGAYTLCHENTERLCRVQRQLSFLYSFTLSTAVTVVVALIKCIIDTVPLITSARNWKCSLLIGYRPMREICNSL